MKISDIKDERVFDVLADIVKPVADIVQDSRFTAQLQGLKPDDTSEALSRLVPFLLKEHRNEVAAILGALDGKTAEEYMRGLSMSKFIGDIYNVLTDEGLLSFLSEQGETLI